MKRIPSRLMPQYILETSTPLDWLVLAVFLLPLAWLAWTWPALLLLIPIVIAIDHDERRKRKTHYAKLFEKRRADSICTFARNFDAREIDTWVIRAVYEQLQNHLNNERPEFPIRPTDDVYSDLLIDEEDFEFDLVEEIAKRTGRSLVGMEKNPYYGKASVVENLVYFFNRQPLEEDYANM